MFALMNAMTSGRGFINEGIPVILDYIQYGILFFIFGSGYFGVISLYELISGKT